MTPPQPISLFSPAWLALPPAADRADVLRCIEEAERRAEAALVQLRAEAGQPVEAAAHDRRIESLLAWESRTIPAGAAEADKAIERFMMEVAFRKRDLMPRFHALGEHARVVHRHALAACRDARWALMALRALADPGVPSSPIHGSVTRYVKSDRYDARAARNLPVEDRVRADRRLKRLGDEDPTPAELALHPMEGHGGVLWAMSAGNANRFILRRGEAKGAPCLFVEDVGPHPTYDAWVARR
ncbi:hypothetical protein [Azospirillum sp. sgz302134]